MYLCCLPAFTTKAALLICLPSYTLTHPAAAICGATFGGQHLVLSAKDGHKVGALQAPCRGTAKQRPAGTSTRAEEQSVSAGPAHPGLCHRIMAPLQDTKKDVLKVAGAGWLALGAHNAYNAHAALQPKEIAIANAVGQSVLGALCLWKGFGCDEK